MEKPHPKARTTADQIATLLQYVLNIALILLGTILCYLLGVELLHFIRFALFTSGVESHYKLLESILVFFLYFEFVAMIVKYFKEKYHFPIRYFLYIGITALIRLIIVHHENPLHTLFFTGAVLVLVISFYIMNSATARRAQL